MQNENNSAFNPLIVQGDRTLLLDVHAPHAKECRNALLPFAELERSPEHLHTYRLSPLSLWNAASAGLSVDHITKTLQNYSRYAIPESIITWITEIYSRYGKIILKQDNRNVTSLGKEDHLLLYVQTEAIFKEIASYTVLKKYITPLADFNLKVFELVLTDRGTIKYELLKQGWPVQDEVPLQDGDPLVFSIKQESTEGKSLMLRSYQTEAASSVLGDGAPGTGFGTIVLPCGSGKTIVGMILMEKLQTSTLIVTTNISAVRQWKAELLDKTTLVSEQIGEYSGEEKTICDVTIATYQILTWRKNKAGPYPHFQLFKEKKWGLIIYDEVHLLPAPIFRVTAELQATRRAGLTATLVREDGCEGQVFSLVGPKRYDVPWKELESAGWIATAECIEFRLDLPQAQEYEYAGAPLRQKHRIAGENLLKLDIVQQLVTRFVSDKILVIGQYLTQLTQIANALHVPIITGKTPSQEREQLYQQFREGIVRVLVVSKVANFAIDLPDASIAIQVSGTFGSRQEEAQRLGRILRPKERVARFITLITRNTQEEIFGANRQKFLTEQGYSYRLVANIDEIPDLLSESGNC